MEKCPCGSGKKYAKCCEPFINGDKLPTTPEQLMRSRYTAYVKKDIDYIDQTTIGPAARDFTKEDARNWADYVTWLELQVVQVLPITNDTGQVEFIAKYSLKDRQHIIHEISEFRKQNDRWYYYDGKYPKTGRNDSCPCGSGKKYKKCCGKG